MASNAAAAPQAATKKKSKAGSGKPHTPWWMWLAVAAIVVFCLFPFYWLISISLKTGADLQSSNPVSYTHLTLPTTPYV